MNIHLHIANVNVYTIDEDKLKEIMAGIKSLNSKSEKMGQELDNLTKEVAEAKTVMASALTLIKGFKQKLDDAIAAGNPAKLTELSTELDASSNELAAAVAENTAASTETGGGTEGGDETAPQQ